VAKGLKGILSGRLPLSSAAIRSVLAIWGSRFIAVSTSN